MSRIGSIQKRGKNSWYLVVSSGVNQNGKQMRKTKTVHCSSKKEAEKALAAFITEIESGIYVDPSKLSFKDFTQSWLKNYASKNLAPKTLYRYSQILDTRILPAMGHLKLDQIRPSHLLSFYINLQEDGIRADGKPGGLSERTVLHNHRIIHTIFETAVRWQMLSSNPVDSVTPPKVAKKRAAVYDEKQLAMLLAALNNEPFKYQVIVLLAISTGMRQGEIMGLEWPHIDFSSNTISVCQAAQYLPGAGIFIKDPKNETSKRVISVPESVMLLLKKYKGMQAAERLQLGDKWEASKRIFTSWNGKPMYPNLMSSWFPRFLRRNNLPHLPFHGLRHTSATMLIYLGIPATDLSRRLGHSNTSTTMNIYTHALAKGDAIAAEKMDTLLVRTKLQTSYAQGKNNSDL